jgi:hypothetical protein
MGVLHLFHPLVEIDLPIFVDEFHPKTKVILNQEAFNFALVRSPCPSSNGPSNVVYELLQYYFVPYDFANGFNLFFNVYEHIAQGHVPPPISHLIFTS